VLSGNGNGNAAILGTGGATTDQIIFKTEQYDQGINNVSLSGASNGATFTITQGQSGICFYGATTVASINIALEATPTAGALRTIMSDSTITTVNWILGTHSFAPGLASLLGSIQPASATNLYYNSASGYWYNKSGSNTTVTGSGGGGGMTLAVTRIAAQPSGTYTITAQPMSALIFGAGTNQPTSTVTVSLPASPLQGQTVSIIINGNIGHFEIHGGTTLQSFLMSSSGGVTNVTYTAIMDYYNATLTYESSDSVWYGR
jgi:hypothetical protein